MCCHYRRPTRTSTSSPGSTMKVHMPTGTTQTLKLSEATDVKVKESNSHSCAVPLLLTLLTEILNYKIQNSKRQMISTAMVIAQG